MRQVTCVLLLTCLLGGFLNQALAGQNDVRRKLEAALPEIPVKSVERSQMPGFYLATLGDGTLVYVSEDGGYMLAGNLFRLLETGKVVNLTEQTRGRERRKALRRIPADEMVVFSPEGGAKAVVTVFTDIDCGYCRRLHQEMAELNRWGIEVRYLAFPRAGVESESYDKIVSAWCADNPRAALTRAKQGRSIPDKTCSNPVREHLALGREMGVTGTPAMVLQSGRLIPGYLAAAELARELGIN